jgi:putative spermidine/putrescine transport system permease protein
MGIVISPMVVPIIITAAGSHIFFSKIGLAATYSRIIPSHALLGLPFVVVTVIATLAGFDRNQLRAASRLFTPFPTEEAAPDSL